LAAGTPSILTCIKLTSSSISQLEPVHFSEACAAKRETKRMAGRMIDILAKQLGNLLCAERYGRRLESLE
jgi:hypothetical protein